MIKSIPVKKGMRILDLGCGEKPFLNFFDGCEYIGIDFDDINADICLDLNNDTIPYADCSFDLILISETLEHIYDTNFFLSEVKRLLKKEGSLFITTPFMFPEHGIPHDYFRYTKYFYFEKFKDFSLVDYRISNYLLAVPFLAFNLGIASHKKTLFLPVILINNIIIIFLNFICKYLLMIFKDSKLMKIVLSNFPAGYSFIFKK